MWIIQSNLLDHNQIIPLMEALREFDIPFVDVNVVPFSDEFAAPLELTTKNVIPYGSTKLCKIAEKRGWTGLFFNRETFRTDCWNKNRSDMLNNDAEIMTVYDVIKKFRALPQYDIWFIRPVEDLKQFNGTLTTSEEIARWTSSVESGNFAFDENILVSIAPPKEILKEWRYFVVDRKVITGSTYKNRGLKLTSRVNDPNVLEEAQHLADGWLPHETCVMDVAQTDKGLKIVEFNCINSSGFYYHDIKRFVKEVNDYFERLK